MPKSQSAMEGHLLRLVLDRWGAGPPSAMWSAAAESTVSMSHGLLAHGYDHATGLRLETHLHHGRDVVMTTAEIHVRALLP